MCPSTVKVNVILANNKVSTIAQHYQQLQQTRKPFRSSRGNRLKRRLQIRTERRFHVHVKMLICQTI